MPVRATYPAGMPCWIDCITADLDLTRDFYADLFGWTFRADTPAGPSGYHLIEHGGAVVGGLGVAPPGRIAEASWTTYLATKDLDATLADVPRHGGTVIMPPMRAGADGRLFLAVDPLGAVVGFWQGAQDDGIVLVDEPGAMVGHVLRTPAVAAADFYRALLPLTTRWDDPLILAAGALPAFAIREASPPARWVTFFGAADPAGLAGRALELGAERYADAPGGEPDGGAVLLRDPAGAVFGLRDTG